MNCAICRVSPRPETEKRELRQRGWFLWDPSAPSCFNGVVLCPACARTRGGKVIVTIHDYAVVAPRHESG